MEVEVQQNFARLLQLGHKAFDQKHLREELGVLAQELTVEVFSGD